MGPRWSTVQCQWVGGNQVCTWTAPSIDQHRLRKRRSEIREFPAAQKSMAQVEAAAEMEHENYVDGVFEEEEEEDAESGGQDEKERSENKEKNLVEGTDQLNSAQELTGNQTQVRQSDIEESESENEDHPEMDKRDIYHAVRKGNIEELDDLLDLPKADINMTWVGLMYGENLLMIAIQHRQQEMAEFLIDNGVNWNFTHYAFDMKDDYLRRGGESAELDCYSTTCRQMAYDRKMLDLVDLIDEKNGNYWSFKPKKERIVRLKKPFEEKMREREEKEKLEEQLNDSVDSGRSSRASNPTTIATEVTRADTRPATAATSRAESAKAKRAKAASTLPATSGYESAESLDLRELIDSKRTPRRTTVKYRNTRSFYARKLSSRERLLDRPPSERLPKASFQGTTSSQRYSTEVQHLDKSRAVSARGDLTRVVSPWKQDDRKYVAALQCRNARSVLIRPQVKSVLAIEDSFPCLDQVKRTESTLLPKRPSKRPMETSPVKHSSFRRLPVTKISPNQHYMASLMGTLTTQAKKCPTGKLLSSTVITMRQ
ncbi:hypothetical protein CAPTEDRAFT_223022 [Capitella teleta]|uniref:Uncharacterized protein n=1 Tax=Capitella teleta TaxID=283909 RepID=R7UH54_CAPTE|nr:hypothetical protein CAPTEDRAFT_223022 [Capitella teleta]|eukprot:ELU03133.1 hypothetical protein CAPTEDRAFT_223022 [Capitella teleta]